MISFICTINNQSRSWFYLNTVLDRHPGLEQIPAHVTKKNGMADQPEVGKNDHQIEIFILSLYRQLWIKKWRFSYWIFYNLIGSG